jgi:3-hydroxyacyl-CoA dehydrogenase/enoyl-CoA hydratase/3-hydroxybutyryl-CoA epimerase
MAKTSEAMTLRNFKFEVDADGIAVATWDNVGRPVNVITEEVAGEIYEIIERLATDAAIKGLVLASGKSSFCAGADLNMLQSWAAMEGDPVKRAEKIFAMMMATHAMLRKLETVGKPVVAAINGTALGGGLEIALSCHRLIAADNPRAQIGLPEAKIGIMPGAGGTQRVSRRIGAAAALPLILEGKSFDPKGALQAGLIHELVPPTELLASAKRWIKNGGEGVQPWDKPDFKVPGGGPYSDEANTNFIVGNALLRKRTYGNYPGAEYIMRAVYEGLMLPIDLGLRVEARYATHLMGLPSARSMIRSLFLSMQDLNKLAGRPEGVPPSEVKKLGVLGAGMMGSGITYVSALAGIDVVLLDTTQELAEKGKAHSAELLEKQISRGRQTAEGRDKVLARIKPTARFEDLADVGLIIEAVFEDRAVKEETIKKAEALIPAAAVFGSNTSTLPITGLAKASMRPKQFIGIHFFSPVDRMPLVEIIKGKATAPATIAKAMDYVKKIGKTPIVVNDSRGFYTSRCFSTYVDEGAIMLAEGIAPAIVDNVGRMTGMPRGPLEVSDDVALDLQLRILEATKRDLGEAYKPSATDKVLDFLVVKNGRLGRKNGKGYYDYLEGGKKRLWPGLRTFVTPSVTEADPAQVDELKKRLLCRQALEAARCVAEGVVTDPRYADVGAILGWGFAPYTGGPLSYIDSMGAKAFVETCAKFARKYGERFRPNKLLRDMAAKGETFYGRFAPQARKAEAA